MHSNETRACWRHKGKKAALRAGGSENVRGVSPHSAVCGGSSSAGGGARGQAAALGSLWCGEDGRRGTGGALLSVREESDVCLLSVGQGSARDARAQALRQWARLRRAGRAPTAAPGAGPCCPPAPPLPCRPQTWGWKSMPERRGSSSGSQIRLRLGPGWPTPDGGERSARPGAPATLGRQGPWAGPGGHLSRDGVCGQARTTQCVCEVDTRLCVSGQGLNVSARP